MRIQIKTSCLLTLLFSGLLCVGIMPVGRVQASNVSWILSTDTTWTKAGSPYTLVGNLLVDNGVTLTIQPGVTVNINGYVFRVNGTIRAVGNSVEQVTFNDGTLEFYSSSSTGVFDYATFKNSSIASGVTLKVTNSNLGTLSAGGSSEIANNKIDAKLYVSGSVAVKNNQIKNVFSASGSCTIQNNVITGKVTTYGESLFSSNAVTGIVTCEDSSAITNNVINGDVSIDGNSEVSYNTITGNISVAYNIDTQIRPLIAFNTVGNGITVTSGSQES